MTTVYALLGFRGQPRYVGKTTRALHRRVREHFTKAQRGSDTTSKGVWIAGLEEAPDAIVLEEISGEEWGRAERRWIRRLRERGHRLLNETLGGNGSHEYERSVVLTEALISRLGKEADARIAEDLGVTRKAITYHRKKLRIDAAHDRTRNVPPPPMAGHNRKTLPEEAQDLYGTAPDAEIAERLGVSKKVITSRRNAAGIASYAEQTGNDGRFKTSKSKYSIADFPEELIEKMGTMPDTHLGREFGVQPQLISKARRQRGIDAYQP